MARFLNKRVISSPIKRNFLKNNVQKVQVTNDIKGNVVALQEIKEKVEEIEIIIPTIQVDTTTPKEDNMEFIEPTQEEEKNILEEPKENNVTSKKRKRKHDNTRKDNASQSNTI